MEIASGLSALKSAADLTRLLRDAAKADSLKQDEFAGRIAEVYDYIGDSKEALSVQEKISELRAENERLRAYVFHHSVSWRKLPDGSEDGPFCPTCVSEGTPMRLLLREYIDQTHGLWHLYCPKTHVGSSAGRDLGRGREPIYAVPKELVSEDRYFLGQPRCLRRKILRSQESVLIY